MASLPGITSASGATVPTPAAATPVSLLYPAASPIALLPTAASPIPLLSPAAAATAAAAALPAPPSPSPKQELTQLRQAATSEGLIDAVVEEDLRGGGSGRTNKHLRERKMWIVYMENDAGFSIRWRLEAPVLLPPLPHTLAGIPGQSFLIPPTYTHL